MPRSFALALVALALASPAFVAAPPVPRDPPAKPGFTAAPRDQAPAKPGGAGGAWAEAPERLLPPSTQLYLRWDGLTAHPDAYQKSIWGGIMAGPTGDNIRALVARAPKLLGASVLADPLLDGKSPAELKANLTDLKATEKLIGLLTDKGALVAAEVREPAPTLKGVGQALGGLVGGKLPGAEAIIPDAQMTVIVPDVGDRADVIYGSLRLLFRKVEEKIEPFEAGGRKGFRLNLPSDGPVHPHVAWWVEGKHFVFYTGTRKPADVIAEMATNATKGGLTGHPLFQRCIRTGEFESVTRGFVDTGKMMDLAKGLAGPFVPGLKERLDGTGLAGVKAVVFASGFDGKESRALYEIDVPGERKGLTKVLKNVPLGVADLPPMPPDVSRFSALRVDPAATYDAGLGVIDLLAMNAEFGVEDDAKKNVAAAIKARKAYLMRETDKFLGISVTDDLLPYLGDRVVTFQSPTEGLQVFGTVVCISVKDADKVRIAADRVQRAIEAIASSPVKVRKKTLKGVEYREFYSRGFGFITPTYAVVGDWLVVAGHPQMVQGVILRSKGDLEKWAPDAATAKRLAKMPTDGCGLQYCDPKSSIGNLCCIGPLALGTLGLRNQFTEQNETDFNPIDMGVVPNAHELGRHLFPNLTITRDDGKTIRIEVNESFSLPLEAVGAEPFAFALLTAAF
ncbi:hypothetical protein [Frigoriglobus tundricola]|uniref:DUF3352 domain-containing protein n=1 Tax=Frigoriglobus tundricola TaxID=2774151 RepID=A0A6M5YKN1_9BACT|nr:hypothetical protein [Frigoriglobus tundricola]QJW94577.1 hypothetical protein FTUN_2098 [Frigoriglobus tundricola]